MDDKIILNKSNLFKSAYAYTAHLPGALSFCEVLAEMINSGKYMFTASLLMNSSGQMRRDAAEAYWRMINGDKADATDVENIMYVRELNNTYKRGRYFEDAPITITPPKKRKYFDDDFVALETATTIGRRPKTYEKIKKILDDYNY